MSRREKRICSLWRLLCFKPGLLTLMLHLAVLCCLPISLADTKTAPELVMPVHYHSQNLSQPSRKLSDSKLACPLDCVCKAMEVNCKGAGWKSVAAIGIFLRHQTTIQLDMSHNDISHLEEMAFADLRLIEELNLSGNRLSTIRPKVLDLPRLRTLRLDFNELSHLDMDSFSGLPRLRHLRLDHNLLGSIPVTSLTSHPYLETLNLSVNRISRIPSKAFQILSSLVTLVLDRNEIELMEDEAFSGLRALRSLELRHNQLDRIPVLRHMPQLQELYMNHNHIRHLPSGLLQEAPNLTFIDLRNNPLHDISEYAFAHLPRLLKLILSDAKSLTVFPHLNGTSSLELIRIDRSLVRSVPADVCRFTPKLRSLELRSNRLTALPDLTECQQLRLLDLSHNRIINIPDNSFQHLHHLHDLILGNNHIEGISMAALAGLNKLKTIDLVSNNIRWIHPEAFMPLIEIQDVNLGNNFFPSLPSVGLENVQHLKTFNNPNLQDFPNPNSFPKVQTLALSYAYHCCPFIQSPTVGDLKDKHNSFREQNTALQESVIFPWSQDIDLTAWAMGEGFWTQTKSNNGSELDPEMTPMHSNMTSIFSDLVGLHANLSQDELDALLNGAGPGVFVSTGIQKHNVQCLPKPGPFMPCHDLFDWWALRCGAWLVFLMALLGNGVVVFVLIFARSRMDVPRFLVCNLAMADFFMGIYLGFLAVVDASTLGEFRMYAIPWQLSTGCQVAGFLGVLSSELSVYTLAVITMERNYAITHAMHLNKRLSLRHAAYIMSIGWTFALIMAVLPLVGVSDYRKFAVCLPFEVEKSVSLGYVVFLMFINGVAFLTLMGCYLKMYCAIRGSQAWNSNDSRIAKRMALLVFTDFLCWAPIAFFSVTAAFGLHLVSLEEAKVFTVFILPLNSCCNPFLYAILTKQFKKDCVMICKAIEESRVTRGIGRCRHSSNFSNRQTPINTNSVGDRNSSRDGSSCQCSSRLLEKPKTRSGRWGLPTWHALVSRWTGRERDSDLESSHDCAYQVGDVPPKRQTRKRRAESVSSDNFSSSRSGSIKAFSCGLPLHFKSGGRKADGSNKNTRQRNTWIVTRKPSSDSNLSNSRNDSSTSALTASTSAGTSAWRTSRSSVSSDGGSSSTKLLSRRDSSHRDLHRAATSTTKLAKNGVLELEPPEAPSRFGSFRDKTPRHATPRHHPTSPLAAGIIRQQSFAGTSGIVQRTVVPAATAVLNTNNPLPDVTVDLVGTSNRPKPRLTRQLAVQQDEHSQPSSKSVSFDPLSHPELHGDGNQSPACPLHQHVKKLQGVFECSFDEYDEPYSDSIDNHDLSRKQSKKLKFKAPPPHNPNRLGLAGFIPRKLSTISSRSVSMNPEPAAEPEEGGTLPALHDQFATVITAAAPALTLFPHLLSTNVHVTSPSSIRKYKSENSLQPSDPSTPTAFEETSPDPTAITRNRVVSKSDNTLSVSEEADKSIGHAESFIVASIPSITSSTSSLGERRDVFVSSE